MKRCKIKNFSKHTKVIGNCNSIISLSHLLTAAVSLGHAAADASSSLTVKEKFNLPTLNYTRYTIVNTKPYVFLIRHQKTYTVGWNDTSETSTVIY